MNPTGAPLFHLEAVEHHYAGRRVLAVAHLRIAPGTIVGLMGPNGSGKSTLLRLLGFLETPSRGRILFKGRPAAPFDPRIRGKVTLLPQDPYLMNRSVADNVAYGLKLRGGREKTEPRVQEALAAVGLAPERFARRPWYALSGGEAQRVALAARLVLEPQVLLMDEPTASVDAESAERIRQAALTARARWGTTLIVASHDWSWLFEVCDEVWHLFAGEVFPTGTRTFFPGPWEPGPEGRWRRRLADGQHLAALPGKNPAAAAVIDSRNLMLSRTPVPEAGLTILAGTVLRLALIRRSAKVVATLAVGELTLTAILDPEALKAQTLIPGDPIHVAYRPEDLRWVDSPGAD
jgi:tungstate transport system ATP-binding protein